MTDAQVLDAIEKIQRANKTAETRAGRRYAASQVAAFRFYGSSDVEQAARHNYLRRAGLEHEQSDRKRRITRADRLQELRSKAGSWADLVPTVAQADLDLLAAEVKALLKR
jgi:hypothetical protein